MANAPATKQELHELAKALKECRDECKTLGGQMTALQVELAEARGMAMPTKVDDVEKRVRALESKTDSFSGAIRALWAFLSFIGLAGIYAILKASGK